KNNAGVAHYVGLTTCGSIWACPVCSAQVRNHRAGEISEATARWDRAGNTVYMATFTAPHDLGDRLRPLLGTIADGFRAVVAGRTWTAMKKRLGIVGTIRSMEVTHGRSGWHPHLHVLIYVQGDMEAAGLASMVTYLRSRWRDFVVSKGYRPPSDQHGVDVQRCASAEEAGLYIAKTQDGRSVGNEVARADLKQGRKASRTPFEILDDFRWSGDCADLDLWNEYETATKGRQCITWSKALRQILQAAEEQSNEEIVAADVGGDDVAIIDGETWKAITQVPGLPAGLLDAIERGGLDEANDLLGRHHLGSICPPDLALLSKD
ncbi:protein rep, partial [Streptosporangium lutulentum]